MDGDWLVWDDCYSKIMYDLYAHNAILGVRLIADNNIKLYRKRHLFLNVSIHIGFFWDLFLHKVDTEALV